jgi:hypothetical protein
MQRPRRRLRRRRDDGGRDLTRAALSDMGAAGPGVQTPGGPDRQPDAAPGGHGADHGAGVACPGEVRRGAWHARRRRVPPSRYVVATRSRRSRTLI